MKDASPPRFTLQPEAPAHQLDDPRRDGQAETAAAIFARDGTIGLREGLEDALLTLERNADAGVRNRHMQDDDVVRRRLFCRDAKNDLAVGGKLDGVPEQIDENLT